MPTTTLTLNYKVIEDNSGGLHLFVFDAGEKSIFTYFGYEHNIGQLTQDLDALVVGDYTSDWDGNEDDPQAYYEITASEYGWEIVATGKAGVRTLYTDKMGIAASLEFNQARI